MKHFVVKTKDGHQVDFDFPNSVKEISNEYLTKITDSITIADNYTLVALCYSEKLSNIILTARTSKQNTKIKVIPIFVKGGKTDIEYLNNAKMKQRVVVMNSQLSLGVHVNPPYHKLTLDYFSNVVQNAKQNVYEEEVAKADNKDCVFIEFKILPNSDIMGLLDIDIPEIEDNYVKVVTVGE